MAKRNNRRNNRFKADRKMVIRKMDNDTYRLRRAAMKHIYEAKALVPSLPRINIRITDAINCITLGSAHMGSNSVSITADAVENGWNLKRIVYHEILHGVYSIGHVDGCPLMDPYTDKKEYDSDELDRLFKQYATEA